MTIRNTSPFACKVLIAFFVVILHSSCSDSKSKGGFGGNSSDEEAEKETDGVGDTLEEPTDSPTVAYSNDEDCAKALDPEGGLTQLKVIIADSNVDRDTVFVSRYGFLQEGFVRCEEENGDIYLYTFDASIGADVFEVLISVRARGKRGEFYESLSTVQARNHKKRAEDGETNPAGTVDKLSVDIDKLELMTIEDFDPGIQNEGNPSLESNNAVLFFAIPKEIEPLRLFGESAFASDRLKGKSLRVSGDGKIAMLAVKNHSWASSENVSDIVRLIAMSKDGNTLEDGFRITRNTVEKQNIRIDLSGKLQFKASSSQSLGYVSNGGSR